MVIPSGGQSRERSGLPELLRQTQVREVAGDGNMVEVLRLQIGAKDIEHIGPVLVAASKPPRSVSEHPLIEQCAWAHSVKRGQVQIGQVGKHEIGVRRRDIAVPRVDLKLYRPIG
jgi:hypothetical protein